MSYESRLLNALPSKRDRFRVGRGLHAYWLGRARDARALYEGAISKHKAMADHLERAATVRRETAEAMRKVVC